MIGSSPWAKFSEVFHHMTDTIWEEAVGETRDHRDRDMLNNEREIISIEARRYAGHYPAGSDGRNTFILLAEWIETRMLKAIEPVQEEVPKE